MGLIKVNFGQVYFGFFVAFFKGKKVTWVTRDQMTKTKTIERNEIPHNQPTTFVW